MILQARQLEGGCRDLEQEIGALNVGELARISQGPILRVPRVVVARSGEPSPKINGAFVDGSIVN